MFTKYILRAAIVLTTAAFTFMSCQKDSVEAIDTTVKNTVSVEFDNRIGDQKLALGTTPYKTAAGEDFTVTTLNYFREQHCAQKDRRQRP